MRSQTYRARRRRAGPGPAARASLLHLTLLLLAAAPLAGCPGLGEDTPDARTPADRAGAGAEAGGRCNQDDVLDEGEACDGDLFRDPQPCVTAGFVGGHGATCDRCQVDTSPCRYLVVAGGESAGDVLTPAALTLDRDGNAYVTGSFQGAAVWGKFTLRAASGQQRLFVAKVDARGVVRWARALGTTEAHGAAVAVAGDGSVVVAGHFKGKGVDFGGGYVLSAEVDKADVLVLRLSAGGATRWARRFGDAQDDRAQALALDRGGNVYVTGKFQGSIQFTATTRYALHTSANPDNYNTFVAKLKYDGTPLWDNGIYGYQGTEGRAIAVDGDDNTYLAGDFFYEAFVRTTGQVVKSATSKDRQVFVWKLGPTGNELWAAAAGVEGNLGGSGQDSVSALLLYDKNVFITGHVSAGEGAATFGERGYATRGARDLFVALLDSASGQFGWATLGGGASDEEGRGLARAVTDKAQQKVEVLVVGRLSGSGGWGYRTLRSTGSEDLFYGRIRDSGEWIRAEALGTPADDRGVAVAVGRSGQATVLATYDGAGTVDGVALPAPTGTGVLLFQPGD